MKLRRGDVIAGLVCWVIIIYLGILAWGWIRTIDVAQLNPLPHAVTVCERIATGDEYFVKIADGHQYRLASGLKYGRREITPQQAFGLLQPGQAHMVTTKMNWADGSLTVQSIRSSLGQLVPQTCPG